MKKIIFLVGLILMIILISVFTYNRFKTKRINNIIGANQFRIEKYLGYPNNLVQLDTISINSVDPTLKKLVKKHVPNPTRPLLRYTVTGSIRKHVYWLLWKEDDYYVIEAIDTNI